MGPTLRITLLWILILTSSFGVAASFHAEVSIRQPDGKAARDRSNVVVWLTPVPMPAEVPKPPVEHFRLVQKNKQFSPHVLVLPVGSTVDFPNEDPFFHNVFSLFQGKRFDLGLYEAGSTRSVKFDRVGVSFIFCNIHPQMSAAIISLPTYFYAVSDQDGKIDIRDVPAGKYRMQVWNELASAQELASLARDITVESQTIDAGKIAVHEVIGPNPPHKNKYGKSYDTNSPYNVQ